MHVRCPRSRAVLGTLSACWLVLMACSSPPTPTRSRVQAALVTSGLPRAEAACATKQLFKVLTTEQLRNLAEHGSGALQSDKSNALTNALGTCTSVTTAPSTAPSSSVAPGATTAPQSAPVTSNP